MTAFQERLQKKRKEKGLTQSKLAELSNVSKATINKYETKSDAAPTADILLSISKVLDVSVDWLLGNDEYCVKSVSETEKITSGDIKRAFEMLFTAFGNGVHIVEATVGVLATGDGLADDVHNVMYFDDPTTEKYIVAYKQLYNMLTNEVDVDKKTRCAVLDAVFPKEEFVQATLLKGGYFEDDVLPFDV